MKDAFAKLISTAEKAKHMDEEMVKLGYSDNLYADIFGDIADAIYKLLGENTKTFESSFTYVMLNTDAVSVDGRATLLSERFKKRLPIT